MKKALLTLALAAMVLPMTLRAQITTFPWTEGFENGATGWTIIDSDNDGITWQLSDTSSQISSFRANYPRTGNSCIIALSYNNLTYEALTPDEWLISPALVIPSGESYTLSFYDNGTNASYAAEHYEVHVATSNTIAALSATTPLISQTLSDASWIKRTADLSAYAGQTIYIGFHHYNCTDQFCMGIDDIRVGGPETPEISINVPAPIKVNVPATFTINGTANSYGWYVDGTVQTETSTSLTYTFTTAGNHTVVASATNTAGTTYDTVTFEVFDCNNITLPYTPSFTTSLGCWDTTGTTLYGYNWIPTSEAGLTYGQALSFSRAYSNNQWYNLSADSWLISPAITMPTTGSYEIGWKAAPYSTYVGDHYGVCIVSGTDTTEIFSESIADTGFVTRAVAIPSTVTGSFKVAFHHYNNSGDTYVLILDEIEVREQGAPILSVSGPAMVRTNDPAVYTATSNASTFAWYINDVQQSETSNTFTTTFATAGSYTVKVVATTATDSAEDSVVTVAYSCDAITSFPWTEGFENGLNNCWTMVSGDAANDGNFGVYADATAHDGANDFRFSSYARATSGNYHQFLITPELNMGTNSYDLKFWYKAYRASDVFSVKVSTTTADTAAFTTVLADITSPATTWTELVYSLPAGTKYVAIDYYGDYAYYLYIDDIYIGAQTAPSLSISGPATVKVGNPAVYTATSSVNTFTWYVDGTQQTETGNVLTTSFTTAGNHTVIARASNTTGYTEDTVITDAFTCPVETLPYTADFTNGFGCWDTVSPTGTRWYLSEEMMQNPVGQVLSISAQQGWFGMTELYQDNWLISPEIAMGTGSYEISWRPSALGAPNNASDHYTVYVISGTNFADTTAVFSETLTAGDTTFAKRVAAIPGTVSGNFKIAFRHHDCTGGYAMVLDSIMIQAPSLPEVTVSGPTSVMAGVSATFTALCGNATSYSWTVDGTAQSETSNTLTTTFTTAGNHTVSVTATNAVGTSAPATMTVEVYSCDPITTLPWTEGFEGTTDCWIFYNGNTTDNGFQVYPNEQYANSGSAMLFGAYNDDDDVDQWAISPAITLPSNATNLGIEYYIAMTEYQGIMTNYEVRVSTTGANIADFTNVLYTENNSSMDDGNYVYVLRSHDLSNYAGQTIRIAFHNMTAAGGDVIMIDDVTIGDNLGIENVNDANVAVYPNPVRDMLTVKGDNIQSVEIIDVNGRTVLTSNREGQLSMSDLAEGVYMVRVVSAAGVSTQKIVKK